MTTPQNAAENRPSLLKALRRRLFDRDYSPAYQDEYQRLWHETANERDDLYSMLEARKRNVSYGPTERFFDTDAGTTRLVKRRYQTWHENGEKFGWWDYVPADVTEKDAT